MTINPFHSTPVPYDTTNTDGDKITVHKVLDDGRLLCEVHGAFGDYAHIYNANGSTMYASDPTLNPPQIKGRREYDALPAHWREVFELTFSNDQPRKILGVKTLRAELDLSLGEAKTLWEQLHEEYHNALHTTVRGIFAVAR